MDLFGYAALGGLERLTIVAGAVIIGYWGYRLYTAEKNAGLVFMGLAVVVLVGALVTGGSYLRSVGEGYQMASLPAQAPAADSPFAEEPAPAMADVAIAPAAPAAESPPVAAEAAAMLAEETAIEPMVEVPAEQPFAAKNPITAPASELDADVPLMGPTELAALEADDSPARLATGAELGGRIVSVKSENVSLEWSSAAGDPDAGSQ